MEFLVWIEGGSIPTWVRESLSLWAYPSIVAFHAIGLAFLVGTNVALNLRVLGVAKGIPVDALRGTFPVMWAGFAINAVTGVLLLTTAASKFIPMPVFIIKMLFIFLAMTVLGLMKKRLFGHSTGSTGRLTPAVLAKTSMFLWFGAFVMGRLTAYPLLLIDLLAG
jgi:hypothetical protein